MEKSGKIWSKGSPSHLETAEVTIESVQENGYNSDTVSIRSLIDGKAKVTGTVTGNEYIFNRAGSVVLVDTRDKDEILNKKRGRSCCGGNSGKHLFELVEE